MRFSLRAAPVILWLGSYFVRNILFGWRILKKSSIYQKIVNFILFFWRNYSYLSLDPSTTSLLLSADSTLISTLAFRTQGYLFVLPIYIHFVRKSDSFELVNEKVNFRKSVDYVTMLTLICPSATIHYTLLFFFFHRVFSFSTACTFTRSWKMNYVWIHMAIWMSKGGTFVYLSFHRRICNLSEKFAANCIL